MAQTLESEVEAARAQVAALAGLGIDLDAITQRLEDEGVAIFAKAFDNLLHHIETKAGKLAA